MRRTVRGVPTTTEGEFKWEVTIEGDDCPARTQAARISLIDLLKTCLSTPGLLDCGNTFPQTIKIKHDNKWVILLEAVGP
jgi:hypothetical protein